MSLFRLTDLQRLGGSGKKISDLHRSLFPGGGTVADREKIYLVSKGATAGTIGDRWRKVLSTPPGTLAALP